MDNINLKNFGEIISTEEYIIDKEKKVVAQFNYKGKDIETKYTYGNILISATYIKDDNNERNEVVIKQKTKKSEKIANLTFNSAPRVLPLYAYKNIIEDIFSDKSKDLVLTAKKYTYESSTSKSEKDFDVSIICNNTDVTLTFDIDYEVLVDGRVVIARKGKEKEILYIIGDKSYKKIENNCSGNIDTITYVDFSYPDEPKVITFDTFGINDNILSFISHYMVLPYGMNADGIDAQFDYDTNGLLCSSSLHNVLNEGIYLNNTDKTLDYKISIHPLYYDDFNNELIYGNNLYCLDQIENESGRFVKVTRRVYKIDDSKLEELNSLLRDAEYSDHPIADLISFDDDEE